MIDFSDIVADPDLAEPSAFTIIQTTRVLATGSAVDTKVVLGPFDAPVIPGASTLARESDGSKVAGTITVYSPIWITDGFRINDFSHRLADVVTWHGDEYVVQSVSDWSRQGFWSAVCTLRTLSAAT